MKTGANGFVYIRCLVTRATFNSGKVKNVGLISKIYRAHKLKTKQDKTNQWWAGLVHMGLFFQHMTKGIHVKVLKRATQNIQVYGYI